MTEFCSLFGSLTIIEKFMTEFFTLFGSLSTIGKIYDRNPNKEKKSSLIYFYLSECDRVPIFELKDLVGIFFFY